MSPLLRKEIRLVIPAWVVSMLLAVVPVWILWPAQHLILFENPGTAIYAPFALGVLLLGLTPFGQELNHGTFSMLLAQPVPRRELWTVKTRVLVVALVSAFLALCLSNYVRVESLLRASAASGEWLRFFSLPRTAATIQQVIAERRHDVLINSILFGGVCSIAAFASGLWTNLLLRNATSAFWISLVFPLGLGMLANGLLGDAGLVITLGLYSVAGFLWARKFFLRFEDTQWTGGVISLSTLVGSKAGVQSGGTGRRTKPLRALIRKEFQMHELSMLIGGLLLLSHLLVIGVRRIWLEYFTTHKSAAMIWEFWPLLWLVMPLLVGGVAVAEERKLGTLESFLCLPARRRREFAVKFLMALVLVC